VSEPKDIIGGKVASDYEEFEDNEDGINVLRILVKDKGMLSGCCCSCLVVTFRL